MPRNITVTLADGSQHVYANAPDDITPDAVTARAQKDFGQGVTALDGGKNAAPAEPAIDPTNGGLNLGTITGGRYPAPNEGGYQDFIKANYVTDAAGKILGPPGTKPTVDQNIQGGAEARAQGNDAKTGNFLTALKGGVTRGLFGVPERLAAAGEAYLPSAFTGNTSNASYDDILKTIRANTDADMAQSTAGNITGQVVGGLAGGRAIVGGLGALASTAAEAASPIVSGTGNALQELMTLRNGEKAANAAKLLIGGGAAGATQAAGEGTDVGQGAAHGVLGSAVLGTGFKAAQVLTRPVRDFLQLSSAGQILKRLTTATQEQIEQKAAQYRADTQGAEPTLFELLPQADQKRILKQAVVGRDPIVEQTSQAIRARASNLGPEMSSAANQIVGPQRRFIQQGIARDLGNARPSGTPTPEDIDMATRAINSPTDMLALRDHEARTIMAPHDNAPVVGSLEDLYPSVPAPDGSGARIATDPEVSAVIRSAAGTMRQRPQNAGITAGDVSDMISTLRGDLGKGGIEGRTAQRAIDHLEGTLQDANPEAAAAQAQMTAAYAARSRMAEGMQAGAATKLRDNVQVGTSRREARKVVNAFDTPEGAAGRTLGQSNQVLDNLAGSPEEALRATVGMSRGSISRELGANLGDAPGGQLMAAARAQDTSAQALSQAANMANSGGEGNRVADLASALVGLHPGSFIATKAHAVKKILSMTHIPENRARTMVDMLFSQDPAMTQRAISALSTERGGGQALQYLSSVAGQLGAQAGAPSTGETSAPPAPPETAFPEMPGEAVPAAPEGAPAEGGIDPNVPYGRQVIQKLFPEAHINEDVRDPNSTLGRENPDSDHVKTQNAVDVRPIKGMTFKEFIDKIHADGHEIVEAIDEVNHPSKYATGPHWHVVLR